MPMSVVAARPRPELCNHLSSRRPNTGEFHSFHAGDVRLIVSRSAPWGYWQAGPASFASEAPSEKSAPAPIDGARKNQEKNASSCTW